MLKIVARIKEAKINISKAKRKERKQKRRREGDQEGDRKVKRIGQRGKGE